MNGRCDFTDIIETLIEPCIFVDCSICPSAKNCFYLFRTDVEILTVYKEGE